MCEKLKIQFFKFFRSNHSPLRRAPYNCMYLEFLTFVRRPAFTNSQLRVWPLGACIEIQLKIPPTPLWLILFCSLSSSLVALVAVLCVAHCGSNLYNIVQSPLYSPELLFKVLSSELSHLIIDCLVLVQMSIHIDSCSVLSEGLCYKD